MRRRTFLSFLVGGPVLAQGGDPQGPWDAPLDPKLPNVLLIGDSISIGYTRAV